MALKKWQMVENHRQQTAAGFLPSAFFIVEARNQ